MHFEENRGGGISRRAVLGLGAAAMAALGLSACGDSGDSSSTTTSTTPASNDPHDIAIDAYVFGYPLVLTDVTRETGGPANQFVHQSPPTPQEKQVVRLNLDTLYSQSWLDLRAEPMVLQVPAIESGRYWLMQLMDAWTNTVHDPSSMDQQIKHGEPKPPYTYLLTGPGWSGSVPAGMTQLAMPTGTAWLLGRIEYKGGADVANVRGIQQQLKLAPLSVWSADPNAVQGGPGARAAGGPAPAQTVAAMDGPAFFNRLCAVMASNPPAAADAPAMKRFATIGVKPGATIDPQSAELLTAAAVTARKQIPAYHDPQGKDDNGWVFDLNVGAYGTDYPLRAQVAMIGLGANLPKDAVYPTMNANADGGKRFRLTFAKGELPPVGAFWSLTAYDAHSYLIDNPAGIYSVGHLIPVAAGADGKVEITIQSEDPGSEVPVGNWLPIPASGPFSVTLRLYAPKTTVLEGKWSVPKLETVG
ncbi:DUF1254 domain-containing protein [Nocardia inohanensis]|uniref:DUF1254 domain-containing protein n=1 Tax=Nocardia inohanensis TaxID=209246 RepID=UPI00083300B0|nr:DUF1254 domain-containing protein [Nocardia inohanensis]